METEEQAKEGISLEAQVDRCKSFCKQSECETKDKIPSNPTMPKLIAIKDSISTCPEFFIID